MIKPATHASVAQLRLKSRESSSTNGTTKWNTIDDDADEPSSRRCERSQVPGDLFRQVAGPDDQELREREVGPEHHEREHELAEVVEVSADRPAERAARSAPAARASSRRTRTRQHLADRRTAGRRSSRYQCGSSDITQSIAANVTVRTSRARARRGQRLHLRESIAVAGAVLLARPAVEEATTGRSRSRSRAPCAPGRTWDVEIRRLVLQDRVGRHHLGARPGVERCMPSSERHEQQRHQRQRARRRFEHAADRQPQRPAGQVVQHEERQRSRARCRPEQVADQIGAEELRPGSASHPTRAEREARRADRQRDRLRAVAVGRA